MKNHWSDAYVGLPYREFGRDRAGCDCWGLACILYREQLSITLPDYLDYGSVEDHQQIASLISGATSSDVWSAVAGAWMPFDIATFRRGRIDTHVGIVIHAGLMLHMLEDDCSKVESFRAPSIWSHRLTGIYRHADMTSRSV